mgnify:CR=1 FL=1
MSLYRLCLFAALDLFQIFTVNPFFCIATTAADISVYINSGENSCTSHQAVSMTIGVSIAVNADNIIAVALGANSCCFHVEPQSSSQFLKHGDDWNVA